MELKLSGVEFEYPEVPVLEGVSFELNPHEILSVVGKNGAGKSTLIKCINRILEHKKGKILLDSREVKKMKKKEMAQVMAYLPQNTSYNYTITVFDVVLAGWYPHLSWNNSQEGEERVWAILKMMDLESIALRDYKKISGGQQQQVIIARSLVQNAKILLLDEPTNNLDIRHQLEVMNIIRKIVQEKQISAVVAIHDLNLASRYSHKVIMLNNGIVYCTGKPLEVFTPENIAEVYGVEVSVTEKNGRPHIIPLNPIY